ncbi:MAG: T9SS type A sorting domain-containing protein [Bacteroidia bacterium]
MKTLKTIISICILNILFFISSNAQIVYTDVIPDQTFSTNNSVYHLDLNNDGTIDFDITILTGNLGPHPYAGITLTPATGNYESLTYSSPSALSLGSLINNSSTWSNGTYNMAREGWGFNWHNGTWVHSATGNWLNATDKYLGLKFAFGGNTYYGWARLDAHVYSNGTANFTIKDYAYNGTINQPILAGQMFPATIQITGSNSICPGDSVTLTATAGTSFNWSTGDSTSSITVSPLTTTTYSVVVSDSILGYTTTLNQQIIINITDTSLSLNCGIVNSNAATGSTFQWIDCANMLPISGATFKYFSPANSGNYAVIIGNSCGFDTSSCAYVQIFNFALNGVDTICSGYGTILIASGGTSYLWSTGETTASIIVSPMISSNFSVTVSDSVSGCSKKLTHHTTTLSSPIAINHQIGNTLFTTIYSNASYQWIDCSTMLPIPGAVNYSYTPTTNGSYAAIINLICTDTSPCINFMATAITEYDINSVFSVFPNPATNSVTIKFPSNEAGEISIENIFGQIIFYEKINTNKTQIDISNFSGGFYLLRWNIGENIQTQKFTVIK